MSIYQSLAQNVELLKQIIVSQAAKLGYASSGRYEQVFTNSERLLRILKANLQYQYNHCVGELALLENQRLMAENRTFRQQLDRCEGSRGESVDNSVQADLASSTGELADFSRVYLFELIKKLNGELRARIGQVDDLTVIKNEIESHLESQQQKHERQLGELQQRIADLEREAASKLVRVASLEAESVALRSDVYTQIYRNKRLEERCEEYERLLKQSHATCLYKQELLEQMEARLRAASYYYVEKHTSCEKEVYAVFSDSSTTSSTILKTQHPVAILYTPSVGKYAIPVQFNQILMPPEAIANNELQRSKKMRQSQLLQQQALDGEISRQKALESGAQEYLGQLQRNLDEFIGQDLQDSSLNTGESQETNSSEYPAYLAEAQSGAYREASFVLEISEVSGASTPQAAESSSTAGKIADDDAFTQNNLAGAGKDASKTAQNVLTAVQMMQDTDSQEMDDLARIRRSVGKRCQRRTPSRRRLLAQNEH